MFTSTYQKKMHGIWRQQNSTKSIFFMICVVKTVFRVLLDTRFPFSGVSEFRVAEVTFATGCGKQKFYKTKFPPF